MTGLFAGYASDCIQIWMLSYIKENKYYMFDNQWHILGNALAEEMIKKQYSF